MVCMVTVASNPERKFNIGSVKAILCGGTSIPPTKLKEYTAYFGGTAVIIAYGSTETTLLITACAGQEVLLGLPGVLYPNSSAMVIDEHGNETDRYEDIYISGPHVMAGYVGKGMRSPFVNGLYHTGDYAQVAANGIVSVRGMLVDVVHTKNGPIALADIENMASGHPAAKDCAAIGVGPRDAAQVLLFVVLAPGIVSPKGINHWIQTRVEFDIECKEVQGIPKLSNGNILRQFLK
ncbi:hypothetical protein BX661DRAFT_71308 [Kickxella alabastrina]|uniref:uncharacterized protein n=1 Tax=Kickxella alabastrina TaxID=61397 RepID=UPI00221F403C|nr:uncharacterized protein BX661DRAFT_71308 [Kickxella alabastrina]KAI7833213.1 hypothetical protein BX661DRAFT_71308 [Kickxella alabastrina]